METQNFDFFCQKSWNWMLACILACAEFAEINLAFVNISLTVVIDTSIEMSLWVLYSMGTQKFDFLFKKGRNWILTCILTCACAEVLKSPKLPQYQSHSDNWYMIGEVFTSPNAFIFVDLGLYLFFYAYSFFL